MTFKELLKSKDMTVARLARTIKVNGRTVYNWTTYGKTPSTRYIPLIAKALDVNVKTVLSAFEGD